MHIISIDGGKSWINSSVDIFAPENYQKMVRDLDIASPVIILDLDLETPVSIWGPVVRADWYEAGEGYSGDYNPDDPDDEELLRFDIYIRKEGHWEAVEDASYCTQVPVNADVERKAKLLATIYNRYADVLESDPECSVKKMGEELSWIA